MNENKREKNRKNKAEKGEDITSAEGGSRTLTGVEPTGF